MRKIILNPGQEFGKWTVLEFVPCEGGPTRQRRKYLCRCVCGTIRKVYAARLHADQSGGCGCKKPGHITHGKSSHPLFRVWATMKSRCYNKRHDKFGYYGAIGIGVCDEWRSDFKAFFDWALANGYSQGLTIERKNGRGNYEPSNCCWATMKAQTRNTSRNHLVTYRGRTMPLVCWCDELGLAYSTIKCRLNKLHWTPERAFETPIRKLRIRGD